MAKTKAAPFTVDQTGDDLKPTLDVSAKGLSAKQVQELIDVLMAAERRMKSRKAEGVVEKAKADVLAAFPDARIATKEEKPDRYTRHYTALVIEDGIELRRQSTNEPMENLWRDVAKELPKLQERLAKVHQVYVHKETTTWNESGKTTTWFFVSLDRQEDLGETFGSQSAALEHIQNLARKYAMRITDSVIYSEGSHTVEPWNDDQDDG